MRRLGLILIALGFMAYIPSLGNGFVWDDEQFIQKNVFLTSWSYVDEIFTTNTIAGAGQVSNYYRPLTTVSFLTDRQMWGLTPFGFHLTNMLLHIGAGVVLFLWLRALGVGQRVAFWIGVIFLVHPIQTEAVVYANSRGDSLFALWLFVALYALALSFRERGVRFSLGTKRFLLSKNTLLIISILSYVLSVLSKEIGLAGLGLYGLVLMHQSTRAIKIPDIINHKSDIINHKSGIRRQEMERLVRIESIREDIRNFRAQWTGLLVIGLLAGIYVWLRLTALNFADSLNFYGAENVYTSSLWVRMFTFGRVFWTYLRLLVWPYPLHMERTVEIYTGLNLWFGVMLGLLGILGLLGWWEWKKLETMWVWFGLVWFGVMILPISGIVPINGILYEHWLYVPMVGFFVGVVGVIRVIREVLKRSNPALLQGLTLTKIGIGVMVVFLVLTWRQNWLWGEPVRFYEYTLAQSESARLRNNLGMSYADRGRHDEAISEYRRAVELAPIYPQVFYNMANTYAALGDAGAAEANYAKAIELNYEFHLAYGPLINLYIEQERFAEALPLITLMAEAYPANVQFQLVQGQVLWKLERVEEAEAIFERVLVMTGHASEVDRLIEGIRGE